MTNDHSAHSAPQMMPLAPRARPPPPNKPAAQEQFGKLQDSEKCRWLAGTKGTSQTDFHIGTSSKLAHQLVEASAILGETRTNFVGIEGSLRLLGGYSCTNAMYVTGTAMENGRRWKKTGLDKSRSSLTRAMRRSAGGSAGGPLAKKRAGIPALLRF
jgi:hypothetical protein